MTRAAGDRPAAPGVAWRLAVFVAGLHCAGCNLLDEMARQQARRELSSFRTTAWLVAVTVGLTLVARAAAPWRPAGQARVTVGAALRAAAVVVLALASAGAALIASGSAPERPPSAAPYAAAYAAAALLGAVLAADAVLTLRAGPRTRAAVAAAMLLGGGVAIAVAFTPRFGGPIVDAFEPGASTGCARYARGGWACWGLADRPRTRAVAVPEGPRAVFAGAICGVDAGRLWCSDPRPGIAEVPEGVTAVAPVQAGALLAVVAGDRLIELDPGGTGGPDRCTGRRVGPARALAIGSFFTASDGCLLRPDGTVSCWADTRMTESEARAAPLDPLAQQVLEGRFLDCPIVVKRAARDVRALVMGDRHALALTHDGALLTWGTNDKGQLGRPSVPAGAFDDEVPGAVPGRYVEVAARGGRSCARTESGEVLCWGDLDEGPTPAPRRVPGLPPAERVFLAGGCACALAGGALHCWMSGCTDPVRDVDSLRWIAGEVPHPDASTPRPLRL